MILLASEGTSIPCMIKSYLNNHTIFMIPSHHKRYADTLNYHYPTVSVVSIVTYLTKKLQVYQQVSYIHILQVAVTTCLITAKVLLLPGYLHYSSCLL